VGLAVAGDAGESPVATTTIRSRTNPGITAIAMFRCWVVTFTRVARPDNIHLELRKARYRPPGVARLYLEKR
jgi:hypothetical protein